MSAEASAEDDWDWFDEQAEGDSEEGFDGVGGDATDERIQAGAEHLRAAAREMIAASRALLDVAEELVEDPNAVKDLAGFIGSLGSMVGRNVAPWSSSSRPTSGDGQDGSDDDDPPVQRIPVT